MKRKFLQSVVLLFTVFAIPKYVNASSVEVIKQGNEPKMDNDYAWTFNLKNTKATASNYHLISSEQDAITKAVQGGFDYSKEKLYWIENVSDCTSGKIYVEYDNVGMYEGKQVNLKITVTNCVFGYEDPQAATKKLTLKKYVDSSGISHETRYPSVMLNTESIQALVDGLRSLSLKYEFTDSNGKTLNVKGYGTLQDLDFSQAFKLGQGIHKAYIYGEYDKVCQEYQNNQCTNYAKGTHLYNDKLTTDTDYTKYKTVENAIQSSNLETFSDRKYKYAWSTVLFNGNFDITFYLGEPDFLKSWWQDSNKYEGFGGGMYRFVPDSLLEFPVTDPKKNVDKNNISRDESFTFTTSHRVPYINLDGSNNKYTAYSFNDKLEPSLTVNDISDIIISNDLDKDVTNQFDINLNKEGKQVEVIATAKSEFLNSADFYGHEYQFKIKSYIKGNYDLSNYLDHDKQGYTIPNVATIIVTDNGGTVSKDTNKVEIKIPIPKTVVKVDDTGENISIAIFIAGGIMVLGALIVSVYMVIKKNSKKM